jgi:hypothetical protein
MMSYLTSLIETKEAKHLFLETRLILKVRSLKEMAGNSNNFDALYASLE